MKTALVTGSNGFIGKKLVQKLHLEKIKVIEFSRNNHKDITHEADFSDLPQVDTVFHLAAVSGYKTSNENVNLAYQVNVGGTVNVLNFCRRTQAKLVFPSTYVYAPPFAEHKTETGATSPNTHYSMTKWLGEELCRLYSRIYNINTLILRTANVYGFGQDPFYIVPKVVSAILSDSPLILTRPDIERGFIYIDDLVEAYFQLAAADTKPGEIFNVGPEKPTQLQTLVKLISQISGKKNQIGYSGENRPNEGDKNRIDNSKIKARISWRPNTSLRHGLETYLNLVKKTK